MRCAAYLLCLIAAPLAASAQSLLADAALESRAILVSHYSNWVRYEEPKRQEEPGVTA
ncbi:hypothetical protein AIOL_001585 [Candidatus Rhodobacter oscarellae]|uniref:Uncharacterized protein n=1 Tax=Candidatus Rhodobacter oscarellae TaxID=1675527 RepID=A0A0J9E175_9RHOB|nr:hypothetical protein AIOL_001585 [Candidatus Rhodobacter lobularis]